MSDSLRSLSNQSLAVSTRSAASRERGATRALLEHLIEVERRKVHLELGYSSMFDYCTRDLGCSSGAAFRRIQTARCMARFPALGAMLERNEVNISTVAQISRVALKSGEVSLLSRIRHKSQREVDEMLGEFRPIAPSRERVRAVVVVQPSAADAAPSMFAAAASRPQLPGIEPTRDGIGGSATSACEQIASGASPAACEKSVYFRSGADAERSEASTAKPKRIAISFMVQPEFMASVEKIRALAWHRLPANASLEQLLQLAMNYMIEKEDPLKRSERRAQRKVHAVKPSARVRHIAAAARDDVFARDHGRCTFVGPDGRRCSATTGLQIDHVTPVSLGGKGDPDNLRLLCAAHNRFEAERMGLGRPVETTSMKKQRDRKESHFG